MARKLKVALVFSSVLAGTAFADSNISYDYATVVDAEPIIKVVRVSTPREECWEETVTYREPDRRNNGVGTVVGGVVGGALGNAVGHKKVNKQVGTVVGAVLGATIGNAISSNARQNDQVYHDTEEVCRVYRDYHEEERIMGYNVRYRYNNETYSTRMSTDPGDTIKIRLAVSPVL